MLTKWNRRVGSPLGKVDAGEAEQDEDQQEEEADEPVAGNPFFVPEGAKSVDGSRGKVLDHPGIVGVWALKVDPDPSPDGGQVKLAEALGVDSPIGFGGGRGEGKTWGWRRGQGLGSPGWRRRWVGRDGS